MGRHQYWGQFCGGEGMLRACLRGMAVTMAALLALTWSVPPASAANWTFETYTSTTGWFCGPWTDSPYPEAPSAEFRACLKWNSTHTQVRGLYHIHNTGPSGIGSGSWARMEVYPTSVHGTCTGLVPAGTRRVCRTPWFTPPCGRWLTNHAEFYWAGVWTEVDSSVQFAGSC
jgi:hypothetical protein